MAQHINDLLTSAKCRILMAGTEDAEAMRLLLVHKPTAFCRALQVGLLSSFRLTMFDLDLGTEHRLIRIRPNERELPPVPSREDCYHPTAGLPVQEPLMVFMPVFQRDEIQNTTTLGIRLHVIAVTAPAIFLGSIRMIDC